MSTTMKRTTGRSAGGGSRPLAGYAGVSGMVGGTLWFATGLVGMLVPQVDEPGTLAFVISGTLGSVTLGLLLIGFLGLAWGGALGGRFGKITFGIAVAGYALMVFGGVQTVVGIGPLLEPQEGVALLYLLGRLLASVFTLLTGIAVLAARRWRGWTAFTPSLLGLCPLVGELGFLIAFGAPSQVFNAAWGVFGALLGLATLVQVWAPAQHLRETEQAPA